MTTINLIQRGTGKGVSVKLTCDFLSLLIFPGLGQLVKGRIMGVLLYWLILAATAFTGMYVLDNLPIETQGQMDRATIGLGFACNVVTALLINHTYVWALRAFQYEYAPAETGA